jgi:glycine/serine hydroxymethyltransferase
VTTTTHKTLRGPRGGMILCDTAHAGTSIARCSRASKAALTTTRRPRSRSR